MNNILEKARAQRKALLAAITSLDDKVASTAVTLFPRLKEDNSLIAVGTRINWHGTLKRAAVDLWDIAGNNPDDAPTLWEDINYRDGIRIIPTPITVGLAFSKDELGWWGDVIYKSLVNNNVYTPEEYAANWEIVE